MNTPTESTAANTNGDASPTSPISLPERSRRSTGLTSFELAYCFGYGFVIGFCLAAGVGVLLMWAVKVTEGLDGE